MTASVAQQLAQPFGSIPAMVEANARDRAEHTALVLGNQQADGMSPLRGWLTAELRAALEAMLAKLAAPGMCNPDALGAALRALLGSHNDSRPNGWVPVERALP